MLVVFKLHYLGNSFTRLESQQVGYVLALGIATALRQLIGLGAVNAAQVSEEQQPVVGGGDEEVLYYVIFTQGRALNALTATVLGAVVVGAGTLGVTTTGDSNYHFLFGDEVFHTHFALVRHDSSTALVTEFLSDFCQLSGDNAALTLRAGQDVTQVGYTLAQFLGFLLNL